MSVSTDINGEPAKLSVMKSHGPLGQLEGRGKGVENLFKNNKQTADYFPHFVGVSKTIFILEHNWGNDGYAFWFKLLELLCSSDGHYYDCSKPADMQYLTAYTGVDKEKALAILSMLADRENIDKELWEKKKLIWCQAFVNNLESLYSRRKIGLPKKPVVEEDGSVEAAQVQENADHQENVKEEAEEEKPKRQKKRQQPEKKHYAEFVTMTEAEHERLVERFGEEMTALCIEKLDNAKGAKGYTYKSDYRAILTWVVDAVKEQHKKGAGNNGTAKRPEDFRPSGGFKPSGGFTPSSGFNQ